MIHGGILNHIDSLERLALRSGLLVVLGIFAAVPARADQATREAAVVAPAVRSLVQDYCLDCHSALDATADVDLETPLDNPLADHTRLWERAIRKLRSRQMPPSDTRRPDEATYEKSLETLERSLDALAAAHPQPGRTATFRRLTRTEYQNAIRDLLDVRIDAAEWLPKDETSQGFDNITVGELSPTLLNRYITAAQRISKRAVGTVGQSAEGSTIRVRPDITQESHVPGLPLGTRGGVLIRHLFPRDGQYEVRVRLARDRNEHVEGLRGRHELEVLLDRRRVGEFTIQPPDGNDHGQVDAHLKVRFAATAGPHDLGVTFPARSASLLETLRQPYQAHFNMHRHPRIHPAVYQVSITGPHDPGGPGDTPSRRQIFVCRPEQPEQQEDCARTILAELARRAWRMPVKNEDLATPLAFYRRGSEEGGFEAGIETALAAILVNPRFLFRIERDPPGADPGSVYHISDLELASRLAFFLWSSIPDDELLELAEGGRLREPEVLRDQVQRMLDDPRSRALVTNFAGQWLYLRNLDSIHPDMRQFPDFDHNLRTAMRTETEMFFESIVREDRSVLDLLRADYTYLNERLARHYGIPHVHGNRFRRVELDAEHHRGGLLRHGSILTVTSYATRTSPVIRGHWILKNLVGTPPPPPPPDVPDLKDNPVAATLPLRQRLAQHRADPNCASCHRLMDPVGFALENYDAVGRWRELESGYAIDASGGLPDGSTFEGVEGLQQALLARPELLANTLAEKLLTYALGRGVDHRDAPAVRRIVRRAREQDYRFSEFIHGIVQSVPFQMRTVE